MMSDMPEKIAAWRFTPSKADEWIHGGWSEDHDHKTTEYVRADRIEELESKLEKAVVALKFHNAAVELCIGEVTPAMKEAHYHTKRTLAELTTQTGGSAE